MGTSNHGCRGPTIVLQVAAVSKVDDRTREQQVLRDSGIEVIGKVLCTCQVDRCSVSEVADVVSNHRFALIKRMGRWDIIESAARNRAEAALRQTETRFRELFENLPAGAAHHEINGVVSVQTSSGRNRWLSVSSAPILIVDGTLTGAISVLTDVTAS